MLIEYICEICNYTTNRKHSLKRHKQSAKHRKKEQEQPNKPKLDVVELSIAEDFTKLSHEEELSSTDFDLVVAIGCFSVLKMQCIDNIPESKRSIHCISKEDDVFAYKKNDEWVIDKNAEHIISSAQELFCIYSIYQQGDPVVTQRIIFTIMNLSEGGKDYIRNKLKESIMVTGKDD